MIESAESSIEEPAIEVSDDLGVALGFVVGVLLGALLWVPVLLLFSSL